MFEIASVSPNDSKLSESFKFKDFIVNFSLLKSNLFSRISCENSLFFFESIVLSTVEIKDFEESKRSFDLLKVIMFCPGLSDLS
jgi:hypothetical protein